MNILAIGAHPDDLENSCGGTLAKYARLGHKVFMVSVSSGNVGHRVLTEDELRRIRTEEMRSAGEIIGAEVILLGGDDLFITPFDQNLHYKVTDTIRYAKPDVIITHAPDDYMDDHEYVSELVYRASMAATVNHYKTEHPFVETMCPIYFMEPLAGVNSFPKEFVDISEDIENKLAMLSCHSSQHEWLREHDNIDLVEMAQLMSRFRGYQCGITYAEGFTPSLKFHKLATKRLLP